MQTLSVNSVVAKIARWVALAGSFGSHQPRTLVWMAMPDSPPRFEAIGVVVRPWHVTDLRTGCGSPALAWGAGVDEDAPSSRSNSYGSCVSLVALTVAAEVGPALPAASTGVTSRAICVPAA